MIKLFFAIPFNTKSGQDLYLCGSNEHLGNNNPHHSKKMEYSNGVWSTQISCNKEEILSYFYLIKEKSNIFFESGETREIYPEEQCDYHIFDEWNERNEITPFLSSPFKSVLSEHSNPKEVKGNMIVSVSSVTLHDDEAIFISGNCKQLGNWEVNKAKKMSLTYGNRWAIAIDPSDIPDKLEYKFIVKAQDDKTHNWEEGLNRVFIKKSANSYSKIFINNQHINIRPKKIRIAGTSIPVFSLRSKNGFGIGEFNDIKLMSDYLHSTGQHLLQILPVNDTTTLHNWKDSYPYNIISCYALHPVYINLELLGKVKDREFRERHYKKKEKLNKLREVDYNSVERSKWLYIKQIYNSDGVKLFKTKSFKLFFNQNQEWLVPYAVFSFLRDKYKTANFREWPEYSSFNKEEINKLASPDSKFFFELAIHYYVQYHLHKQFAEAKQYANSKTIFLKGDLPVGVSRNSAEAWQFPHLFNFHTSAGAPPDIFSDEGQNWGFPTYNWGNIQKEGYMWWIKRIQNMRSYFDAFRIDHILGFFRIWEIPTKHNDSLKGYFNPSYPYTKADIKKYGYPDTDEQLFTKSTDNPDAYYPAIKGFNSDIYKNSELVYKEAFNRLHHDYYNVRNEQLWKKTAINRLQPLINSTDMLACGEDLGMIPSTVPEVMKELHILSLKIERMPEKNNLIFNEIDEYPYLSVCTTSTHDTSNLREWWEENPKTSSEYFKKLTGISTEAPKECEAWLCNIILEKNLLSPSMIAVFPIQDWLSSSQKYRSENPRDERINDPSNPDNYWQYRMIVTIEDLMKDKVYHNQIKDLIASSGRS